MWGAADGRQEKKFPPAPQRSTVEPCHGAKYSHLHFPHEDAHQAGKRTAPVVVKRKSQGAS